MGVYIFPYIERFFFQLKESEGFFLIADAKVIVMIVNDNKYFMVICVQKTTPKRCVQKFTLHFPLTVLRFVARKCTQFSL
jgi:hypothetical protein